MTPPAAIPPLSSWFRVFCTDAHLRLDVRPPGRKPWQAELAWDDIVRVCLETGDYLLPDDLYIFVRGREASYVVPLECDGADALAAALVERRLVDAEEWIEAMTGSGELHCWPAD